MLDQIRSNTSCRFIIIDLFILTLYFELTLLNMLRRFVNSFGLYRRISIVTTKRIIAREPCSLVIRVIVLIPINTH